MSSVTASTLRLLEELIEKMRNGVSRFSTSPPNAFAYILLKLNRAGRVFERRLLSFFSSATVVLDRLQKALYESSQISFLLMGLLLLFAMAILSTLV